MPSSCDIRSDASVSFNGNPTVSAPDIAASGSVSGSPTPSCPATTQTPPPPCDQILQSLPQVPDPWAATYGSELTNTNTTPLQSTTPNTLNPGTYSSLSFSAGDTVTLNPGVYYVGDLTINGNATVT